MKKPLEIPAASLFCRRFESCNGLCVTSASAASLRNGFAQKVVKTTHGSGWIGSDPFYRNIPNGTLIPPTAVGGLVQILSTEIFLTIR